MTKEPERIWIDDERPIGGELHVFTDPPVKGAEEFVVGYIRSDLAEAIVRAALEKAVQVYRSNACDERMSEADIQRLLRDPTEVAAIIKKAGR